MTLTPETIIIAALFGVAAIVGIIALIAAWWPKRKVVDVESAIGIDDATFDRLVGRKTPRDLWRQAGVYGALLDENSVWQDEMRSRSGNSRASRMAKRVPAGKEMG
jgi:hypothetical protein